ncbi:uncharacterized PE-PGRS family protein PE_PGRS54-like [Hermetia illucens]|uniref:uncharacterized PE-PGRS family protein PE_PGRS54-like n=1 Tax=Hermetia illucens TaxID=343691 RepID=UPI0018CBFC3C|nr:uncharacterized PE-PGRS family protein PE_PGRS54-like [Hermetia illucens]
MRALCFLVVIAICVLGSECSDGRHKVSTQAAYGAAFDEVVVDTSLNIRHKASAARRPRDLYVGVPLVDYKFLKREKRQVNRRRGGGGGGVGSSSSSANAASQSHFSRPGGQFGASAANAQAQGFQSTGPLGSFGASAAGTQTQSFQANRKGIQGSAGASGSQTYNLPNGKTVSVTFSNGFSVGPNGRPTTSGGQSVAIS